MTDEQKEEAKKQVEQQSSSEDNFEFVGDICDFAGCVIEGIGEALGGAAGGVLEVIGEILSA